MRALLRNLVAVLILTLAFSRHSLAQRDLALPDTGEPDSITAEMMRSTNVPTDEQCLSYETTTTDYKKNLQWAACGMSDGVATYDTKVWIGGAWVNRTFNTNDLPVSSSEVYVGNTFSEFGISVEDTEMHNEDFGDWTCTGIENGCTLDASVVTTTKILDDTVALADINDSTLLGDNPDWPAGSVYFGASGLLFEGLGDVYEGALNWWTTVNDQTLLLPDIQPDTSDTLVSLDATQVLTAKTLTSPTINGGTFGAGTITATAAQIDIDSGSIHIDTGTGKAAQFNASNMLAPAAVSIGTTAGTGTKECLDFAAPTILCDVTNGCTVGTGDLTTFSVTTRAFDWQTADDWASINFRVPTNFVATSTGSVSLFWYVALAECDGGASADVCWTVDGGSFAHSDPFVSGALGGTQIWQTANCVTNGDMNVTTITGFVHGMEPSEHGVLHIGRDNDDSNGCGSAGADDLIKFIQLVGVRFCYEVDDVLNGE